MNLNGWTLFNVALFYSVAAISAYRGVRYSPNQRISRRSHWVMATACIVWGTGWTFHLLGRKGLEDTFKGVGAILFIVNGIVLALSSSNQASSEEERAVPS